MRLHGHVPQPRRQTLGRLSLSTSGLPLHVMEALQVLSLVQVFVLLLKALVRTVAEALSLLSPLTQTQTTMPQTRPAARTSR